MPAGKASAAESWRMASKMPTDSPGVVFQYFADAVADIRTVS
ncbi:MAG: hypothetical protein R3D03_11215 [Geminicoccaceae bacterium]